MCKVRTLHPIPVHELIELKKVTSKIQDAKRKAISDGSSWWPDLMREEFAKLEEVSADIPYAALDLEYLRDPGARNRSFAYAVTFDTFIAPARDASGRLVGQPEFTSVVKLGDGGRQDGRSAGKASGSIISRIVRSYWEEENIYNPMLHGAILPGNDTNISRKIAAEVGGWSLRIKGDLWGVELLSRISVEKLLGLMEADAPHSDAATA